MVSCLTGDGLDDLLKMIDAQATAGLVTLKVRVPYSEGWLRRWLHDQGAVLAEEHLEDGTMIQARVHRRDLDRLNEFRL